MAFILRRTATTHAHVHAAAARAVRTTSQRALASSSTDFSKPGEWGGRMGGRGERSGSVWEGCHPFVRPPCQKACVLVYVRVSGWLSTFMS